MQIDIMFDKDYRVFGFAEKLVEAMERYDPTFGTRYLDTSDGFPRLKSEDWRHIDKGMLFSMNVNDEHLNDFLHAATAFENCWRIMDHESDGIIVEFNGMDGIIVKAGYEAPLKDALDRHDQLYGQSGIRSRTAKPGLK